MRFRSCENRLVITPVSVVVKKNSGALSSVLRARKWKLAPALFIETMKMAKLRTRADTRANIWKRAYRPV
jgi:hypothetical protein